jgi:hypothetical protein
MTTAVPGPAQPPGGTVLESREIINFEESEHEDEPASAEESTSDTNDSVENTVPPTPERKRVNNNQIQVRSTSCIDDALSFSPALCCWRC